MKLCLRRPAIAAALCLFGCSSSPTDPNGPPDAGADDAQTVDVAIEAAQTECAPAPASKCSPQEAGSVVRGVVTFDTSRYHAGQKVNLAVFLYHQWTFDSSEATIGGHPHAYEYIKNIDVTAGKVAFSIDDCELGVAMYSEENGPFNLVVMLDENGDNDPSVGESALTPTKGELVKMTPLSISCHGDSQCLSITADCVDGTACTTYTPIAMSSVVCAADSCPSQSSVCQAPKDAGSD